jgi:cytochrome c553
VRSKGATALTLLISTLLAPCAHGQDAARGEQLAQACAACHGPDGNSADPQYPILAGQTFRYTYLQLKDYKEGRRQDPDMTPVVANMNKEDMLAVATYYSEQKPISIRYKADAERTARGKDIADSTLCTMCHQGHYQGQNEVPRVAGQYPQYLKKQLHDFKSRARTNDAATMTSLSATLSDEDIEKIAEYLAGLY